MHVGEVGERVVVHEPDVAPRQLLQRLGQWFERGAEVEHLALEHVDPLDRILPEVAEHEVLDLFDVAGERCDDGAVAVHHVIDDGVQHGARPVDESPSGSPRACDGPQ